MGPALKRHGGLRWLLALVLLVPVILVGLRIQHHDEEQNQAAPAIVLTPTQVQALYEHFLEALPGEVALSRQQLAPYKADLLAKLWQVLEQPGKKEEPHRLRAASALAAFDADNPRWQQACVQVALDLVDGPVVSLQTWVESLRPVREQLLLPLAVIFRDAKRRELERFLATEILADYAADRPRLLADLLLDADENQFKVLGPKLALHPLSGVPLLAGELNRQKSARLPIVQVRKSINLEDVEGGPSTSAKRQANAAMALLMMKQVEQVWPLLGHSDDPSVRSYLIHRLGPIGIEATTLVRRLDEEADVSIRRALILSLGEFGEEALPTDERTALITRMRELYRTAEDPGLHGAAEWLLRRWEQGTWLRRTNEEWGKSEKDKQKRGKHVEELWGLSGKPPARWYVNGQGQTMVVIPGPVEFAMGSPPTEEGRGEGEGQHRKRIGRSFALAAKPVTLEEFRRFIPDYDYLKKYAPDLDCPVHGADWHKAASYCNWLNEQEGIAKAHWCYEINPSGQVIGLKKNYLSLTGYRLPTEAEWEYACRAGAITARYFGESEELLGHYAWSARNAGDRTWPVGSKMPNDLGFFDMEGNVLNWCQERYQEYPQAEADQVFDEKEDQLSVRAQDSRVLRGGAFIDQPRNLRSAARYRVAPSDRGSNVGFRPARTIP